MMTVMDKVYPGSPTECRISTESQQDAIILRISAIRRMHGNIKRLTELTPFFQSDFFCVVQNTAQQ